MVAPSLEADLRAAREAAGVAIEQIQQETRIPADVVQRFEAGKLLTDEAFNEVYLKAFLRAYSEAVGLAPNDVLRAYAAARAGAYGGELRPGYEAPPSASEGRPPPQEEAGGGRPAPAALPVSPSASPPSPTERAPAVAALARAPEPEPKAEARPPEAPNGYFPKRRVEPPAPVATRRSFDRSWGAIIGVTGGVVLAVVVALWLLFRDPTPEAEEGAETAADASADTAEATAPPPSGPAAPASAPGAGPRLVLPLRVAVVAGGNGLQNFRVTEAPNERRGHWIEQGAAQAFESSEAVVLWGEGAEGLDPAQVTLRWQGFEWSPRPGQVLRVTPQNGQRLLDSLHAAGARRAAAPPPAPAP